MRQENTQIKSLTVEKLLREDDYIIPIYQRNYAWGDTEIEALLTDLVNAYKRDVKNYYIGSLVVYRRDDGKFEVIDGQQRLTTFTLIKAFFLQKNLADTLSAGRNLSFEYREESDNALDNLQQPEKLPWNFKDAMQSIQRHWDALVKDIDLQDFINFILNNVKIIRTEVPPKTDLNHYFEIMNTRGEQLEKHEILKARLMSRLAELSKDDANTVGFQAAFAKIWDACSDMNRYVVMGFKPEIRKQIFGKNWQQIPSQRFDEIAKDFEKNKNNDDKQTSSQNSENQDSNEKFTMRNIIDDEVKIATEENEEGNGGGDENSERFNSVIDFPNFLLHVLRIYHENNQINLGQVKKIALDDKTLLDSFQKKDFELEDIKKFAYLLLKCRYLFDSYVIKSDSTKEEEGNWSLLKIQPQTNKTSSYQYNNSFGDTEEQRKTVMLLSMFHISYPSRIYKNWLYAVLRWLYQQENITSNQYISFLENLSDKYYFGHYGKGSDFFDLITKNDDVISAVAIPEDAEILNSGTNVPNFIFNRLDYLLWKNKKGQYQNFTFTFRSSVEHFYPQTPQNGEPLSDEVLHSFGNLCLISSSMNSKFSNNMPEAKIANFGTNQNLSLKLSVMMDKKAWDEETWNETAIKRHGKKMIELLNTKHSE
ncbi:MULTISPECIES: DUF262 domain-containing protein [unclassified Avibacterium]|uniref:DUF262 domain-containing protein n=1 Tax=unclassified Avibacterium TaxID=2685287 RepID=UPI002025EED4|nr:MULTISPECIES: DUF262 domain-containing protein [unclassified Avibacterium]MCW9698161.1 DUF262 domain-containing HNH endonuclease family protein [Avibacterium sp. 20-129]URL07536.1 DUF262 domain-containing HNH endonuclease family protein [Avibacterium sp. 21-595]